MILFPLPIFLDDHKQSPQHRKRANRLALGLFASTALVGLAVKYLL